MKILFDARSFFGADLSAAAFTIEARINETVPFSGARVLLRVRRQCDRAAARQK